MLQSYPNKRSLIRYSFETAPDGHNSWWSDGIIPAFLQLPFFYQSFSGVNQPFSGLKQESMLPVLFRFIPKVFDGFFSCPLTYSPFQGSKIYETRQSSCRVLASEHADASGSAAAQFLQLSALTSPDKQQRPLRKQNRHARSLRLFNLAYQATSLVYEQTNKHFSCTIRLIKSRHFKSPPCLCHHCLFGSHHILYKKFAGSTYLSPLQQINNLFKIVWTEFVYRLNRRSVFFCDPHLSK